MFFAWALAHALEVKGLSSQPVHDHFVKMCGHYFLKFNPASKVLSLYPARCGEYSVALKDELFARFISHIQKLVSGTGPREDWKIQTQLAALLTEVETAIDAR